MDEPRIQKLKTDEEFRTLIRPLHRQEYLQLEENIIADGCRNPITVWNGVIIDGHNRYEICRKHGIPFLTEEKSFECREEAIAWICANQLGRRNLSDETRKFLIGLQYENEKIVNERKNQLGLNQYSPDSKIPEDLPSRNRTAHKIAEEYHISRSTVEKYANYTRALETIGKKEPKLVPKILSGKYKVSHKGITELANLPAADVQSINRRLERGSPAFVRYQASRREISQAKSDPEPSVSVKDMPAYNPDAEVTGLCLTIPSWSSSMQRVEQSTDFSAISVPAKKRLQIELLDLQNTAMHLLKILWEDLHV